MGCNCVGWHKMCRVFCFGKNARTTLLIRWPPPAKGYVNVDAQLGADLLRDVVKLGKIPPACSASSGLCSSSKIMNAEKLQCRWRTDDGKTDPTAFPLFLLYRGTPTSLPLLYFANFLSKITCILAAPWRHHIHSFSCAHTFSVKMNR